MYVCSLSCPASNARAPYCHTWPVRLYKVFPHYFINGTILGEKLLNIKCVFWFSLQLLSELLFILRWIQRDMFINIRRWADKFCLHCNIFIYIRHIWMKPVLCSRMVSLFHHTWPWTALPYFSTLSHKRHDFREKLLNIKCVLIFSTTFVWKIFHSKMNSARYVHKYT